MACTMIIDDDVVTMTTAVVIKIIFRWSTDNRSAIMSQMSLGELPFWKGAWKNTNT